MDFGSALGAGISGGFGLVGSGLNYLFNKRLAAQQNQYNIDMWRMQNEYNSPQAQMQRFQEAGLNPNLIYGQGTAGNATSAPQMIVPQAPDVDEHMARLGQLFNIEGLRKLRAERREAESNANMAETRDNQLQDQYEAQQVFGDNFIYNIKTGRYELKHKPGEDHRVNGRGPGVYYFMYKDLLNDYNKNALIPYRQALYNTQNDLLAPQVKMQQYGEKYIPFSYWLDRVSKGASIVTPLLKFY